MTNIYHVLYKEPALDKEEMYIEQELLAQAITKSGKLRIDAYDKINFARFTIPDQDVSLMFSKRELYDKQLLDNTIKIVSFWLSKKYRDNELNAQVRNSIKRLREEVNRYQVVSEELEMKLARLIVQSAHQVVIKLLLLEGAEIFVSYAYNIGDMLDIQSWKEAGTNSGMQSTSGKGYAVFTSAAGDPFLDTEKDSIYGNGFPAIARIMVIIAQEIGHYSDVIRDAVGRPISRHAGDLGGRMPKANVKIARLKDMQHIENIHTKFNKVGLEHLFELERHYKFFKKNRKYSLITFFSYLQIRFFRMFFVMRARGVLSKVIKAVSPTKFLASKLEAMFADMKFNLAPEADVYRRADKNAEEAIACIEALARVPQQAIKWGPKITKLLTPGLHNIYYDQVIPTCIKSYEILSAQRFSLSFTKKFHLIYFIKKLFKKKRRKYAVWEY